MHQTSRITATINEHLIDRAPSGARSITELTKSHPTPILSLDAVTTAARAAFFARADVRAQVDGTPSADAAPRGATV